MHKNKYISVIFLQHVSNENTKLLECHVGERELIGPEKTFVQQLLRLQI